MILGIDPGVTGALALYVPGQPRPWTIDMPLDPSGRVDALAARQWVELAAGKDAHAFIEQVHSMPRQAGAFNFGASFGIAYAVATIQCATVTLVPPAKWKAAMGMQRSSPDETQASLKARARALAAELFPEIAHMFARVKDDGRAEALLLAVYGHRAMQLSRLAA